ncbi:MAG: diguanylate cyclase [Firmicutes bacterium]|nr:diguanylate cyclase [Bacillota bacterium]
MRHKEVKIKLINRFSLRTIIVVPILLIILIGSFMTYLLVERFADRYSEKLISSSQVRIKNHIYDHLDDYFKIPELVNIYNANLALNNQLNLENVDILGKVLLNQVTSNDSIDYSYYANKYGGIVSSGLYQNTKRISYTDDLKLGDFKVYEVDKNGDYKNFVKSIRNFDPRDKSWYIEARENQGAYWTEVYTGAQEDVLGMSTSYPLISKNGEKIGVFGTDILLDQLSEFVKKINTTENGIICIVDSQGMVVASSTDENPFIEIDNSQYRLPAIKSENDVIRLGYTGIKGVYYKESDEVIKSKYSVDGRNYHCEFYNYSYDNKVNWNIMIAIPEQDIISDIEVLFYRFTVGFIIITLMVLFVYIIMSKWILKPIIKLNAKVNEMANENWGVQVHTDRNDELGQLTKSFNKMSVKLMDYLKELDNKQDELEKINSSLEDIVKERTKELELLSVTDSLTSIYNKRFLVESLNYNIELSKRYNEIFSVTILDIDHFKAVNDNFGHVEGDRVLMEISKFLSSKIRDVDVLGRYGGEEFMIIMANTSLDEAYIASERFRKELSEIEFGTNKIKITISGGVAQYMINETLIDIVNRADNNLYKAKNTGRNRIVK